MNKQELRQMTRECMNRFSPRIYCKKNKQTYIFRAISGDLGVLEVNTLDKKKQTKMGCINILNQSLSSHFLNHCHRFGRMCPFNWHYIIDVKASLKCLLMHPCEALVGFNIH